MNAKPSGSNQDISDYLRCFEGGRLQIVDVTDTDNNLIYKFDESFSIYNDGSAENRYVAFKGCKLLASNGSFNTPGQKFAVSVIPHVNEFKGMVESAGSTFSGPTPTVVREVILETKGDESRVGRRYEWGDKQGGDYWNSDGDIEDFLAGNFQFKAYFKNTGQTTDVRFIKEGNYSLHPANDALQTSGFYSPAAGNYNMVNFSELEIVDGYGPHPIIEFDNSQAAEDVPNFAIRCWVYWNWSPRFLQTPP